MIYQPRNLLVRDFESCQMRSGSDQGLVDDRPIRIGGSWLIRIDTVPLPDLEVGPSVALNSAVPQEIVHRMRS